MANIQLITLVIMSKSSTGLAPGGQAWVSPIAALYLNRPQRHPPVIYEGGAVFESFIFVYYLLWNQKVTNPFRSCT